MLAKINLWWLKPFLFILFKSIILCSVLNIEVNSRPNPQLQFSFGLPQLKLFPAQQILQTSHPVINSELSSGVHQTFLNDDSVSPSIGGPQEDTIIVQAGKENTPLSVPNLNQLSQTFIQQIILTGQSQHHVFSIEPEKNIQQVEQPTQNLQLLQYTKAQQLDMMMVQYFLNSLISNFKGPQDKIQEELLNHIKSQPSRNFNIQQNITQNKLINEQPEIQENQNDNHNHKTQAYDLKQLPFQQPHIQLTLPEQPKTNQVLMFNQPDISSIIQSVQPPKREVYDEKVKNSIPIHLKSLIEQPSKEFLISSMEPYPPTQIQLPPTDNLNKEISKSVKFIMSNHNLDNVPSISEITSPRTSALETPLVELNNSKPSSLVNLVRTERIAGVIQTNSTNINNSNSEFNSFSTKSSQPKGTNAPYISKTNDLLLGSENPKLEIEKLSPEIMETNPKNENIDENSNLEISPYPMSHTLVQTNIKTSPFIEKHNLNELNEKNNDSELLISIVDGPTHLEIVPVGKHSNRFNSVILDYMRKIRREGTTGIHYKIPLSVLTPTNAFLYPASGNIQTEIPFQSTQTPFPTTESNAAGDSHNYNSAISKEVEASMEETTANIFQETESDSGPAKINLKEVEGSSKTLDNLQKPEIDIKKSDYSSTLPMLPVRGTPSDLGTGRVQMGFRHVVNCLAQTSGIRHPSLCTFHLYNKHTFKNTPEVFHSASPTVAAFQKDGSKTQDFSTPILPQITQIAPEFGSTLEELSKSDTSFPELISSTPIQPETEATAIDVSHTQIPGANPSLTKGVISGSIPSSFHPEKVAIEITSSTTNNFTTNPSHATPDTNIPEIDSIQVVRCIKKKYPSRSQCTYHLSDTSRSINIAPQETTTYSSIETKTLSSETKTNTLKVIASNTPEILSTDIHTVLTAKPETLKFSDSLVTSAQSNSFKKLIISPGRNNKISTKYIPSETATVPTEATTEIAEVTTNSILERLESTKNLSTHNPNSITNIFSEVKKNESDFILSTTELPNLVLPDSNTNNPNIIFG